MNITLTNSVSFTGWAQVSLTRKTRSGRQYTETTHFYTPVAGEAWADTNEALIAKRIKLGVIGKIFKRGGESIKHVIHVNPPRIPNRKAVVPESARSFDPGPMKRRKRGNITYIS